jgi:ATP-dependent DNA ligase
MPARSEFALPVKADKVPPGSDWLHEIKYDGYRMMVIRERDRVRLLTKGGQDYTERYPWIVEPALKNRQSQFVIDGEAVLLGVNGTTRVGCESGARFISNRCWPAWGPAAAALRRSLGRRSRGGE